MDKKFEAPTFEIVKLEAGTNGFLLFSGVSAFSWDPFDGMQDYEPFGFGEKKS